VLLGTALLGVTAECSSLERLAGANPPPNASDEVFAVSLAAHGEVVVRCPHLANSVMARAADGCGYGSNMPLRYVDPHKKRGLGYWAA
jgi:hypothetical protein